MGLHRTPAAEVFFAAHAANARGALGDAAYDAAEQAGRAVPYAQALAEVEAWLRKA